MNDPASQRQPGSATLTISRITLRILLVLNVLQGVAILALLGFSVVSPGRIMASLDVAESMFRGMQMVAVLGLVCVPLYYIILRRLLDMVESVRARQPFISLNAARLQTIAWALLLLQLLSLIIGWIAESVSTREHPFQVDAGFSSSGWVAVLLVFVLARVFAEGARMREELEGTV